MANTTDTTIPASEVAKTLINSANVLKKPENTTQAAEERAAKDEASAQAQIASLQKATASTQIKKQITRERPYRKTRNEQNFDSAKKNLDTYMTAPVGSPERIAAFINVMKNMSVDCDCCSEAQDPKIKDIGILASLDPVALDKACLDLVYKSEDPGKKDLIERIESRNGSLTVKHAARLGVGSLDYELINID